MKIFTSQSQKLKISNFPVLTITKNFDLSNFKCPKLIENPKLLNPIYVRFKNGINGIVFDGDFDVNVTNKEYIKEVPDGYDLVIQHNKEVNRCVIILIKY